MEKKCKKMGKKDSHKSKDSALSTFLKMDSGHKATNDCAPTAKAIRSIDSNSSDMVSLFEAASVRKKAGNGDGGGEPKKHSSPEVNDEKKVKMIQELMAEMEQEATKVRKKRTSHDSSDSVHFGKVMDCIEKDRDAKIKSG